MRLYTCRYGKFIGDFKIYENRDEFFKEHKGEGLFNWHNERDNPLVIKIGNWVEAMDGLIVQCLNIYALTSKATSRTMYSFRFPMCTVRTYTTKQGFKQYNFYAMFTFPQKRGMPSGSGRTSIRLGKSTDKEQSFVALLLAGVRPLLAYKKVYEIKGIFGYEQLIHKLEVVITHPRVKGLVMEKLAEEFEMLKTEITAEQAIKDYVEIYNKLKSLAKTEKDPKYAKAFLDEHKRYCTYVGYLTSSNNGKGSRKKREEISGFNPFDENK